MPMPDCATQVGDHVVILEGCAVPMDAVCYVPEVDAAREGRIEEARLYLGRLDSDMRRCEHRLAEAAGTIDRAELAVRIARDMAAAAEGRASAAATVLPGWAWTAAGLSAPVLGWALGSLAGLEGAARWGATAGGAALALGAAVVVEW